MKEFPSRLNVKYKDKFPIYMYDRIIAYLRRDLFEMILKGNEEKYMALDEWFRSHEYFDKKGWEKMVETVMAELEELGWTCKTSFGGTGLFIFSDPEKPPSTYYPDGF